MGTSYYFRLYRSSLKYYFVLWSVCETIKKARQNLNKVSVCFFFFICIHLCIYVKAFYIYFPIHFHSFDGAKERNKKTPAPAKKFNRSVSNKFATCSACGTRLLCKLKHPRRMLQVPLYFKPTLIFWKSRLRSNSYFGYIFILVKLLRTFKYNC